MISSKKRFVFSAHIDLNSRYENHPNSLSPSGEYKFREKETSAKYEDLKDFAEKILQNELPKECKRFYNIPISEIKVVDDQPGSIEITFTVLIDINAIDLGIKALMVLIKTLAMGKLRKRFEEVYGDYFDIYVKCITPNNTQLLRDFFFYYLIISNILLIMKLMLK